MAFMSGGPFGPRLPVIGINGPISLSNDFNRASGGILSIFSELANGLRTMFNKLAGNAPGMTTPAPSPVLNTQNTTARSPGPDMRAIGEELQTRINNLPGSNQGVTVSYIGSKYNTPDMAAQFARASNPVAPTPQPTPAPAAPGSGMQNLAAQLQRDLAGIPGATVTFIPNSRGPGGMG